MSEVTQSMNAIWVSVFIIVAYLFYAVFEVLSIIVRIAGSVEDLNAAGAAFEKVMGAIKRIFLFLCPPALGYLVYIDNMPLLTVTIFTSLAAAAGASLIMLLALQPLAIYFLLVVQKFHKGSHILPALFVGKENDKNARKKINSQPTSIFSESSPSVVIFVTSIIVSFVYTASIFVVNIIASKTDGVGLIVVQLNGFINGIGTILVAFVLDPVVSRLLDHKRDLMSTARVMIIAQLWTYAAVAPLFFVGLLALL